jgi:hypothetical protein
MSSDTDYDPNDQDPPTQGPRMTIEGREQEQQYVIPATNTRGNSVRAQCRCSPELMRQLVDLVASRKFPFRTVGDLIRYCIAVQAKRLLGQAGLKSTIAQADMMAALNRDETYHEQFDDIFRVMRTHAERYIDRGQVGQCRRFLWDQWALIKDMPTGYWRARYEETFLKRYGGILDGGQQLGPSANGLPAPEVKALSAPTVTPDGPRAWGDLVDGGGDDDD